MATYLAGKSGAFTYNSVTYAAKSWSVDIDDALAEVTNQNSGGWREYISSLRGASWSTECVFDLALAQLTPGQSLTNLTLSLGGSMEIVFNGLVRKIRPSTSVDGAAMLSMEGVATGSVNTTFA